MIRSATILRTGLVLVCALIALAGCLPDVAATGDANGSALPEQVLADPAPRPAVSARHVEVEPNDDVKTAEPVTVGDAIDLVGTIAAGADVLDRDLFELGTAAAGDRIQADLTIDQGSDVILAVIDDLERVLGYIDQSSLSAGPRQMDITLREPTAHVYVVLSTRSTSTADRPYTARITMQRGSGLLVENPQIVVLNFQGAQSVRIGGRPTVTVPPFDAASISPRFAGQTAAVVSNIVQMVSENYDGLGFGVYNSTDPNIPAGPRSTVYFGSRDTRLLGLADNIDPYNSNQQQSAILYTDTFSVFEPLSPDVTAISQVLANTTSHEIGHLVGLRHTADPQDIMDTTATARQMLVRQWFRPAPMNASVMPLGFQDAPTMLSWTLGGSLTSLPSAKQLVARQKAVAIASNGVDFYIPREQLMGCACTQCNADHDQDAAEVQ